MPGYANPLGLYAEQPGFLNEHPGKFPQDFTHRGLFSAALNLNDQPDNARNTREQGIASLVIAMFTDY